MKVVLVSSGSDPLLRAGVQRLLGEHEYVMVDRRRPGSVYFRSSLMSSLMSSPASVPKVLSDTHRLLRRPTVFSGADLVVHCGGAVMFHGVSTSAWQRPVWDDALGRRDRPPVMSISGGSRFPWAERRPTELSLTDESALRRMFRRTDRFTASDREAGRLAAYFGRPAPVFPSAAMHAGGGEAASGDAFLLNVSPGEPAWTEILTEVVARRARTDRILFLCHDRAELELANERWPEHQAVLPRSTEEYLDVARRGRIALVERPEAAAGLAGLGVPTLAVGSDTRLLMVKETGQETAYRPDATARGLLATLDLLDLELEPRRKALLALEERSFAVHHDAVVSALPYAPG